MLKSDWKKIASERIDILFKEAEAAAKTGNIDRATRYLFLARKLAMKFNLRFSREQRRKFCHKCYTWLQPGKNVQIKLNPKLKAVEYICKACGHINRYPYIKEKRLGKS
ncbi:MAG: ribonuclease P protein component 4 [Candidatus Nanoarchaeia archaeon]